MEGILSEFAKVEKAAPGLIASNRNANVTVTQPTISSNPNPNPNPIKSSTTKSKSKSKSKSSITITIPDAIDDLIQTLETAKHSLQSSSSTESYPINPSILLAEISSSISQTQKSISERQKEFNSALSKLSKALEKKFPIQVSNISDPNLFNGKEPQRALEAVVMEHLIRENKWETAQKFAKEANLPFSPTSLSVFSVLQNTSQTLSLGNLRPAIEWARKERKFLESRGSGLEFALHRSMFVRIALGIDGREQGNPFQAEEVRKVSRKGKEREESSSILNDDHQAELQEVESQVLGNGNGGISDPDGERFEQTNGHTSDGSNSSSSSSRHHHHHSNGNTLNIQSNVEKALNYGRKHFQPFLKSHLNEIQKLFTFLLFLPSASLGNGMENGNSDGASMQLDESIMSFQTAKNDFDLDAELDLDLEVKLDLNDPNNHFGNPSLNYNHHHHPSHLGGGGEEAMEIDERKDGEGEGEDDLPIPSPLHLSLLSILPEPYRPLLHPNLTHAPFLLPMFKVEFCSRAGVAKEPPLRIGVEVGAGGALNRIWKVRNMMMKSGNEWSQGDELPVEIPLPPHLRFHSTFACPVSKEQGTEENPPMMMACGHVICLESLNKLGRREGRLKCPYCPTESTVSQAIRVYF